MPVAPPRAGEARRLGVPAERFAAESGEEYELLVALPPDASRPDDAVALRERGAAWRSPGWARCGAGAGVHASLGGAAVTLAGFDHFARLTGVVDGGPGRR